MPIYEYECSACANVFSVLKLGASEVDTKCPGCGSHETGKRMSTFCSFAPSGTGGATGGGFTGGG